MGGPHFQVTDMPFEPGRFLTAPTAGDTILKLLGRRYVAPRRDGAYDNAHRTYMLVQNDAATTLTGPGCVSFSTTAGEYAYKVGAVSGADAAEAYPMDDELPSTGVPDQALFYVITDGPCLIKNLATNSARNNFAIGDDIVATAGGRAVGALYAGLTEAALANQIKNKLGRAMSASTSDETSASKLIRVGKW